MASVERGPAAILRRQGAPFGEQTSNVVPTAFELALLSSDSSANGQEVGQFALSALTREQDIPPDRGPVFLLAGVDQRGLALSIPGNSTAPPVVANLTPSPGAAISPGDSVAFDVTDLGTALRVIFVYIEFPGLGIKEVVHDGNVFSQNYTASTRNAIAFGYHFFVKRSGGWPSGSSVSMILNVVAVDFSGNEGT